MVDNRGMVQIRISARDMRTILAALANGEDKWSSPQYADDCELTRTRLAYLYSRWQARQKLDTEP